MGPTASAVISLVTLACTVSTLLILIFTKISEWREQKTKFDVIVTGFEDKDWDREVLRVSFMITNHSSAPLSITNAHLYDHINSDGSLNMLQADWTNRYIAPYDAYDSDYKKITADEDRHLMSSAGSVLYEKDFASSGAKLTDIPPINIPAYSSWGGTLTFNAGKDTARFFTHSTHGYSFLFVTSRGLFKKTYHPKSEEIFS